MKIEKLVEKLAWFFVFGQVLLFGSGLYERVINLFVVEFVSAAALYGYLLGVFLWFVSYGVVLVFAFLYLSGEPKADED